MTSEAKVEKPTKKASPKIVEKKKPKTAKKSIPKPEKSKKMDVKKLKKIEKKEQPKKPKEKPKFVFTTGKRKRAIARARIKPGKGLVKVNSVPLDNINNELVKLKIMEPLLITGDSWKGFDINVNVRGGGILGQADAIRQSIAKGLIEYLPDLKEKFLSYDRNLLVFDPRRTEPHKPPRSSQGPRRYKQRSKR